MLILHISQCGHATKSIKLFSHKGKWKEKNLAECVFLKIDAAPERYRQIEQTMTKKMRDSDYLGLLPDGRLYVLLTNTTKESAGIVQERFEQNGYNTEIVEKIAVCPEE